MVEQPIQETEEFLDELTGLAYGVIAHISVDWLIFVRRNNGPDYKKFCESAQVSINGRSGVGKVKPGSGK